MQYELTAQETDLVEKFRALPVTVQTSIVQQVDAFADLIEYVNGLKM